MLMSETRDYEADIIAEFDHWKVYLHEDQRYLGRMYVALKREGEIDPFIDTTPSERNELQYIFNGLHTVLRDLYQPTRLNYSNLRNTWHHCHWHVVPRYDTPREVAGTEFVDENIGKNWSPYTDFKVPEPTFARIKQDITQALNEF